VWKIRKQEWQTESVVRASRNSRRCSQRDRYSVIRLSEIHPRSKMRFMAVFSQGDSSLQHSTVDTTNE